MVPLRRGRLVDVDSVSDLRRTPTMVHEPLDGSDGCPVNASRVGEQAVTWSGECPHPSDRAWTFLWREEIATGVREASPKLVVDLDERARCGGARAGQGRGVDEREGESVE